MGMLCWYASQKGGPSIDAILQADSTHGVQDSPHDLQPGKIVLPQAIYALLQRGLFVKLD